MNNKRYLAESQISFAYAATPLAAITRVLTLHRLDAKGKEFSITLYDTKDAPDNANIYTDSATNRKMWRNPETNESGRLTLMFTLLDEDGADIMFGDRATEHTVINREYFERTDARLKDTTKA